ncbi:flavin reductase family protein [Rhodococcus sp. NCIMB 12038]|uniref:flavin reductase family protein n=1 Tax=Rhodococcus sp. NCIMB 12038 TaxID=933800 RepID=UPI000B3D1623|nr:flavin reductase family protein [Rhodococcus sp. NCIMB 12038]OUS92841.1 hypothetical protein CA951_26250 [Rhodococcus sp. NCIMB 12038]
MSIDAATPVASPVLKRAYGKIPTSVAIITTVHDGRPSGMTVGSLTSVSLEPPLVTFSALDTSFTAQQVLNSGRFQVNLLASGQEDTCFIYASRHRAEERFAPGTWTWSPNGLPRLNGCVLWLECELIGQPVVGDHTMVIGRIAAAREGAVDATPLVFYRSKLGGLDPRHMRLAQPQDFEWSEL